ncbi:hypothetical protein ABID21_002549 [Pseudorhizobium tarimense]|uniref:Uncharacterized protein n=1 Tax=Pseudorhizobium tarimense TaxID=1079109 RepID=A0ABV2H7A8_9HYPH
MRRREQDGRDRPAARRLAPPTDIEGIPLASSICAEKPPRQGLPVDRLRVMNGRPSDRTRYPHLPLCHGKLKRRRLKRFLLRRRQLRSISFHVVGLDARPDRLVNPCAERTAPAILPRLRPCQKALVAFRRLLLRHGPHLFHVGKEARAGILEEGLQRSIRQLDACASNRVQQDVIEPVPQRRFSARLFWRLVSM